jgi:hypothetical protein
VSCRTTANGESLTSTTVWGAPSPVMLSNVIRTEATRSQLLRPRTRAVNVRVDESLVVRRGFSEVGRIRLVGEQVARSAARTRPIILPTDH